MGRFDGLFEVLFVIMVGSFAFVLLAAAIAMGSLAILAVRDVIKGR